MARNVETSTYYMDRSEKFLVEKPYELKFPPPEGFAATNTTWSKVEHISVTDVRGQEDAFNVQENGFQLCDLQTSLSAADFRDPNLVEDVFLKEAAHAVKKALDADRVLVFDYNVMLLNAALRYLADWPLAACERARISDRLRQTCCISDSCYHSAYR